MIYEDLTRYSKGVNSPIPAIRNIGWLDFDDLQETVDRPYDDVTNKLRNLIIGAEGLNLHVMRTRGQSEICCACKKKILLISERGKVVDELGVGQILIPSEQANNYYASPSLVLHYIAAHGYQPPEEFVQE